MPNLGSAGSEFGERARPNPGLAGSEFGERPAPFSELQTLAGSKFGERTGPNPGSAGSEFEERTVLNLGSAVSEFGERTGPNPGSAGLKFGLTLTITLMYTVHVDSSSTGEQFQAVEAPINSTQSLFPISAQTIDFRHALGLPR